VGKNRRGLFAGGISITMQINGDPGRKEGSLKKKGEKVALGERLRSTSCAMGNC